MASKAAEDRRLIRLASQVFQQHGGMLRMAQALQSGVHRRTLYAMRDAGLIEPLARGLYRLSDSAPLSHPDLVAVTTKIPRGVICLISALVFHDLTTQIPHQVWLAIPRNSEPPRLKYPPIRVFRLSPGPYDAGIEKHLLDGIPVKIYSREKTLADCFKYRNEVGLDTILEAVRRYRTQGKIDTRAIHKYTAVCRVSMVARPYLEALL